MFNLQFARYTHDSSVGYFASKTEPEEQSPVTPQSAQEAQELPTPHEAPELEDESQNDPSTLEAKQVPGASSGLVQLGETIVRAIKGSSSESKNILQNMDRILMSMKNDQSTAGCMNAYYHVFKNPLNRKGILASVSCILHILLLWVHSQVRFYRSTVYPIYVIGIIKILANLHYGLTAPILPATLSFSKSVRT